jgi:imidazolonepropionase-like amidohydrolase
VPRERRDKPEELQRAGGSSIENAAILHRSGVQVAIRPAGTGINLGGIVGRDIMHLPVEVGFAIRGGLPEEAGLAAMTIVPARMMGVAHRIGTLEVGKDCDLIVTDGDVLHYQTFVQWAVIDGDVVYDKQEELYFAHIRPRPETELAPEEKVDPGENPPAEEPAPDEEGDEGDEEDGGDDGR